MITTSNSPVKGSGIPNHYGGDLLHTMAISGLSRVRTELLHFVVVPSPPPHPVQLDRQFPGHRYFRDLSPAPHGEVKELAAGQPDRAATHNRVATQLTEAIEQDGEVPRGGAIDDASPGHRREAVGESNRPTSHHLRIT